MESIQTLNKLLGWAWILIWVVLGLLTLVLLIFLLTAPELVPQAFIGEIHINTPGLNLRMDQGLEPEVGRNLFLFQFLLVYPLTLTVLFFLFHLRKIVAALLEGNALALENTLRLRWMGIVILLGSLLTSGLEFVRGLYMASHLEFPGVEFMPAFSPHLPYLFLGILFLILGEVFRLASLLEESPIS